MNKLFTKSKVCGVFVLLATAIFLMERLEGNEDDGILEIRSPSSIVYDVYRAGEKGTLDKYGDLEIPWEWVIEVERAHKQEEGVYYSIHRGYDRGIADTNRYIKNLKKAKKETLWKLDGNILAEYQFNEKGIKVGKMQIGMVFLRDIGDTFKTDDGREIAMVSKGNVVTVPAFEFRDCDEYLITDHKNDEVVVTTEYWHPDVGLIKSISHKIQDNGVKKHLLTKELRYYYYGKDGEFGYINGMRRGHELPLNHK
jgi:hypothetical protein